MSHFAVLVVTDRKPTQDELSRIMQPYHEYVGRITNPNAKWDWWTVGGRWTGMLSPVYDPEGDPSNTEVCILCGGTGLRNDALGRKARAEDPAYTCNGCGGKKISTKWPTQWKKFDGDQIRRGDLQLEALQTQAERRAATRYDLFTKIVAGRALPDWDTLEAGHGIEKARTIYWESPVMKDLRANKEFAWWERDEFTVDRDAYLLRAREHAISPFAIVKDGKWYEKGKMGWWAVTHGEKEPEVWLAEVAKLVLDMPADHWLTVVDCHI